MNLQYDWMKSGKNSLAFPLAKIYARAQASKYPVIYYPQALNGDLG